MLGLMPTFDFRCTDCNITFEEKIPMGSTDLPACPKCAGAVEKLISPPAVIFKGDGFYKTDSAPKPQKKAQETPSEDTKKDTQAPEKEVKKESKKSESKPKKEGEKGVA